MTLKHEMVGDINMEASEEKKNQAANQKVEKKENASNLTGGQKNATKANKKVDRISVHSHVTGLGLGPDGVPFEAETNGLIGQLAAREALGIVATLAKDKKNSMTGRCVLLAGPAGSGKTALAMGLRAHLGPHTPFVHLTGSEVYSAEVKKAEILIESFRKAIGLRVKETKEVYEGEVMELNPEESESPHGGFRKVLSAVIVVLRTTRGKKTVRLPPSVHEKMTRENVTVGDVIYIEAGTGLVSRMGRCDRYSTAFDLEQDTYVPLPKGEVLKKKEIVQHITLHDLDEANSKPIGGKDIGSIIQQYSLKQKSEITDKLRGEVNKIVNRYLEEGIAELTPGVVFIDECHMLDLECFTFLNGALESPMSPIVLFATNRGQTFIRDSESSAQLSAHGIPVDLLDRMLIINTVPYSIEEIMQVLLVRTQAECIELDEPSLLYLSTLAAKTSLRYILSLLQPAKIIASIEDRNIEEKDLKEAESLFYDAKTSALFLTSEGAENYVT